MARIAEAELERLKREVGVAALAAARGVELTPHGADLIGRCPFHEERTASFAVSREAGLFHCFGCGAGGDVIRFIERLQHVSFPEAVRRLAQRATRP